MKVTPLAFFILLIGDPRHEFTEHNQIDDDSSCQQAILANIVAYEGMLSSHEDLAGILIDRLLRISSRRDILYHDCVVDVVTRITGIVEEGVIEKVLYAL